jgi:hypothetical protein
LVEWVDGVELLVELIGLSYLLIRLNWDFLRAFSLYAICEMDVLKYLCMKERHRYDLCLRIRTFQGRIIELTVLFLEDMEFVVGHSS